MSKYRIEIRPWPYAHWLSAGFFVVLAATIWLWQSNVFVWQWLLQIGLSAGLLMLGVWKFYRPKLPNTEIISIDEQGNWQALDQTSLAHKIGIYSRVTAWLLWLQLEPVSVAKVSKKTGLIQGGSNWYWLLRSQLSEQDYRRLCRIVLHRLSEAQR